VTAGAKRFGVRAHSAAFSISAAAVPELLKAALRACTPKHFAAAIRPSPSDMLLPLVSTVVLIVLWQAQTLWPLTGIHPISTFPVLVLGSWRGLVLVGHVADAYGASIRSETRERILDDRFIGSFGVCGIAFSVLIQLSAIHALQAITLSLAVTPLVSGVLGWLAGRAADRRNGGVARTGSLSGVVAMSALLALARIAPAAVVLSICVALAVGWLLRDASRCDQPIGGTVAGHAALLVLVLSGSLVR
jgi:cobalamin synthase